ncbi:MAG: ECF transporter S component [Candidatus Heimdallarchaeaceae archaeon]
MIAIESFRKFKIKDVLMIVSFALIWSLSSYLYNNLFLPQNSYIFSLVLASSFIVFLVLLIRKVGTATLFYVMIGVMTFFMDDLGPKGLNKIIVLFLAGIIFEIFFLIFKLEIHNIPIDIILGIIFSLSTIPLTTILLISTSVTQNQLVQILNMIIISFSAGILGSLISLILWFKLKTTKFILKYQFNQ